MRQTAPLPPVPAIFQAGLTLPLAVVADVKLACACMLLVLMPQTVPATSAALPIPLRLGLTDLS